MHCADSVRVLNMRVNRFSLRSIANVIKASGGDIPDWMLAIKNKRKGRSRVINRPSISTDAPKESGIDGSTSKKTSRRKRKAASQATD